MSCNPATGAQTSHFYVAETDCGTTPASPAWKPLRFTGGNMRLTKDSLQSQMLDGSREVADIRLGSNQTAGEISVELAYADQFDLLEAALGGTWVAPTNLTGMTLDVNATNSTFTRSAGSFVTDGILIGDLIRFTGLVTPVNNLIYQVTNVSALVVTVRAATGTLTAETAVASCGAVKARKLSVGAERRTFSVLTHFADADDGDGEYHITTGVEITGYSFNVAVNALVTGTLSTIGRAYQPDVDLPGSSTFPATSKRTVYSNVDGIIMDTSVTPAVRIGLATSMDLSLDNAASAQFEIGSNDVSFIERGRADSKLSLSTFFEDSVMLNKFIAETETAVSVAMFSDEGAMAFNYPRVVYTSGAPEVAGPASIIQTLEAQALAGKDGTSSISVQYLPVA